MGLMDQLSKRKRSHRKRRKRCPGYSSTRYERLARLETLEARQMLIGSNLFSQFRGILDPALDDVVQHVEVDVAPAELSMGQDTAILGFRASAYTKGLDPAVIDILCEDGSSVERLFARSNVGDTDDSYVLAQLHGGEHSFRITGDASTRSVFQLDVTLVGDVDGDHKVGRDDLYALRQMHGAREGDEDYMVSGDANLDGRISAFDLLMARRNEAYTRGGSGQATQATSGSATVSPARTAPNAEASTRLGTILDRVAGVTPRDGYDPLAPMQFFEAGYGWVQALSLSGGAGHSAVFDADYAHVFDWIFREAGYDNAIYAYEVDDCDGKIDGIDPSYPQGQAASYRTKAEQNTVGVFTDGQRADGTEGHLLNWPSIPGDWEYFSVFVAQNGASGSRNWYPFPDINEDGYSHFQPVTWNENNTKSWYDCIEDEEGDGPDLVAYKIEDLSADGNNPLGYEITDPGEPDYDDIVIQAAAPMMDIDADSDNDGDVDRIDSEDAIEDVAGNGVGQVGKRIFVNKDDDDTNGKADVNPTDYSADENDFATIKLSNSVGNLKETLLPNYSLWLGVPVGLKVWGEQKAYLNQITDLSERPDGVTNPPWEDPPDYNDEMGTWYYWTIDSNLDFPSILDVEGTEIGERDVFWRLVKPGGSGDNADDIVDRDTVEINVENIVWPVESQLKKDGSGQLVADTDWEKKNTSTWEGFALTDAWHIDKSLVDYITTPSSKGNVETVHPDAETTTLPAQPELTYRQSTATTAASQTASRWSSTIVLRGRAATGQRGGLRSSKMGTRGT